MAGSIAKVVDFNNAVAVECTLYLARPPRKIFGSFRKGQVPSGTIKKYKEKSGSFMKHQEFSGSLIKVSGSLRKREVASVSALYVVLAAKTKPNQTKPNQEAVEIQSEEA